MKKLNGVTMNDNIVVDIDLQESAASLPIVY